MQFEFATSSRIAFGAGILQRVSELLGDFGPRLLVIGGKDRNRSKPLTEQLDRVGVEQIGFQVAGEPTVDLIDRGVRLARNSRATGVVGFGGGSVIDSAKAIAGLATNRGEIGDYLEGDVAEEVRLQLEHHLSHCLTCGVLLDSARKTLRIVTDTGTFDLPETAFKPIAERIMARIREGSK